MSQGPRVEVIAFTQFCGGASTGMGNASADQDQGSQMARLIECAGRTCYDSYGRGRSSAAFHRHIEEDGFLSVIEHASLSFFIQGISRGCLGELTRHRHGSFSVRSTRYVDESESEWCWHPLLQPYVDGLAAVGDEMERLASASRQFYRALVGVLQVRLESLGLDRAQARKQARGAARGVLGNALETRLVMTMNLRALRHFIELRATDAADAEIRLLANALHAAAFPFCPEWLTYETQPAEDGCGWVLAP